MKNLPLIALIALVLTGCKAHKQAVVTEREVVKYEKVTELKWDTVYVEIPAQTAEVVTRDSASHLETDYAMSDARINADGTLFHNLKNKPQRKPEVVPTTIVRVDSIVEKAVEVPIYIEKPLSRWQQMKQTSFWWLVAALIGTLAFLLRKPLTKLISSLLRLL